MTIYLSHLIFLLRYRYYYFLFSCKLGIPLYGLFADLSSFLPSEFIPIARHSANQHTKLKDYPYERALNAHHKRNRHHWQYWITVREQDPQIECLPIPERYATAIVCDWLTTAKLNNHSAPYHYLTNRHRIMLHESTRLYIERKLGLFGVR